MRRSGECVSVIFANNTLQGEVVPKECDLVIFNVPVGGWVSLACTFRQGVDIVAGPPRSIRRMHKPIKYLEKAMSVAANGAWRIFCLSNNLFAESPSFTPKWSDKPLLKSREKSKPPLGWPRETDSLCPRCVPEIRKKIVDGKQDYNILLNDRPGEIKAQIIERDGKILMVKDCAIHGHFEDVLSIDPSFFRHLEEVFPGRDIRAHNDEKLHNHGTSTIKHGRG